MKAFTQHVAGDGGWSDWVSPTPKRPYKMACCDCGLVHDLEFAATEIESEAKNGWWRGRDMSVPYRVLFRARRNERSTRRQRQDTA